MRLTMTRSMLALVLAVANAIPVHAACPAVAPGSPESMAITTSPGSCDAYAGCPNGLVTLVIEPFPTGFFPPAEFDPGYTVQPCDVVEWSFGDGTTQSVTGSDRVTHDYPNPGNYTVQVSVSNAMGSTTVGDGRELVIATSPSRLSFVTGPVKVVYPLLQSVCDSCVEAREGVLTSITVMRTLDLSRSISAEAEMAVGTTWVRVPLVFAPGDTQKTFTVTVPDDAVYSGVRYSPLRFVNPAGGTLTLMNVYSQPTLVMIDDDSVPTLSIQPDFAVAEGFSGLTPFSIPVFLTAPMGVDSYAQHSFIPGSATYQDFRHGSGPRIKAGETSGFVTGWVVGNTKPEPNKTFQVWIAPPSTNSDPLFGTTVSTVTILNDDAALYPARVNAPIATPIQLTLDIGSPYPTDTTAELTTSNVNVIPVPEPVVIPAGATKIDVFVTAYHAGAAEIGAVLPGRITSSAEIVATSARRRAASH